MCLQSVVITINGVKAANTNLNYNKLKSPYGMSSIQLTHLSNDDSRCSAAEVPSRLLPRASPTIQNWHTACRLTYSAPTADSRRLKQLRSHVPSVDQPLENMALKMAPQYLA